MSKHTRYFDDYVSAYNYYGGTEVPSNEIALIGNASYIFVSSDNSYNGGNTQYFDANMTNDTIVNTMVTTSYASGYEAGTAYGEAIGYTTGHAAGYEEGEAYGYTQGYEGGYSYGYSYGYSEGEASGGGLDLEDDYFCVEFYQGNTTTPLTNNTTTFHMELNDSSLPSGIDNFQYSFDKENWTDVVFSSGSFDVTTDVGYGNKVYLRGISNGLSNLRIGTNVNNNADTMKLSGHLSSLFYGEYYSVYDEKISTSCKFLFMYRNIKDASALVLPNVVVSGCYEKMFCYCTKLVATPSLPATTLANYCYNAMFESCTSLTTAPSLPATTLAEHCYYAMFYGCTSLVNAPSLPATTLASLCYGRMFKNCTSLTTAPTLSSQTLVYQCYSEMFNNCSSLQEVTCLAIQYEDEAMIDWLPSTNGTIHIDDTTTTVWDTIAANGDPYNEINGWTLVFNSSGEEYTPESGGGLYPEGAQECPDCGGTGEIEGEPCSTCEGNGYVYTCPECGGTGENEGEPCGTCYGYGYLPESTYNELYGG